ncbi:catabolite gene activator protein [Pedobacter lusitanus]|uniref:Catabolite gene activator protein n=1 Tax=Pedobacter lusitanus TaxID=1503925 RepID=A0A0D0GN78_9SPHI|nr:Crp/Fnr family transcriptional regulator [Pedobacter lusitanus]KIO75861.1 catabolite gene activator protein [Pedobacter lusitanus]
MSALLFKNIEKHIQITDEEFEQFSRNFQLRKVKKKDFLLRAGEICRYEAFVTKGCFKVYYLNENGTQQILYFATEDWWATDIDSFTNQIPAILHIEALEDCEILCINKPDKDALFEQLPKVEKLFRIMNQRTLVAFQRRVISSIGKTATERYMEFTAKYPDLENRLTQLQIAAYLGITHEFLNKIKKNISGN